MVEGKRCWLDLDKRIHNCRTQGGLPKASNIREAGYDGHCSSAHHNCASLMLFDIQKSYSGVTKVRAKMTKVIFVTTSCCR